jgi:hypothetical protein
LIFQAFSFSFSNLLFQWVTSKLGAVISNISNGEKKDYQVTKKNDSNSDHRRKETKKKNKMNHKISGT